MHLREGSGGAAQPLKHAETEVVSSVTQTLPRPKGSLLETRKQEKCLQATVGYALRIQPKNIAGNSCQAIYVEGSVRLPLQGSASGTGYGQALLEG